MPGAAVVDRRESDRYRWEGEKRWSSTGGGDWNGNDGRDRQVVNCGGRQGGGGVGGEVSSFEGEEGGRKGRRRGEGGMIGIRGQGRVAERVDKRPERNETERRRAALGAG